MLPDWGDVAIAHPTGVLEIKGFIAKHFGLEIGPDGDLRPRALPEARFKTSKGTAVADVAPARSLATSVARLIASATLRPLEGIGSAADVRAAILASGAPWVGLPQLVEWCWGKGIPVIYLPALPGIGTKMDGMVTLCRGRPVIFIAKTRDVPAWVLFVLAHELGHIGSNHLIGSDGDAILDEAVDPDAAGQDVQEQEANTYAIALLTGGPHALRIVAPVPPAPRLAEAAILHGRKHKIDPGHVLLNAGKHTKIKGQPLWALANAALNRIEKPGQASEMCRKALRANIDLDLLPDSSQQFLEKLGVL